MVRHDGLFAYFVGVLLGASVPCGLGQAGPRPRTHGEEAPVGVPLGLLLYLQYASLVGQDNGWVLSLIYPPLIEFDKSIIKYPNIRRFPGGASTDLRPNLQDPSNPVPAMDPLKPPRIGGGGG